MRIAIIGAGLTGLGAIFEIADKLDKKEVTDIVQIDIFDKSEIMGAGLAFNPETTDSWQLFNFKSSAIKIPDSDNYFEFIKSKKDKITERFYRIFEERFVRKFEQRFGKFEGIIEPNFNEKKALREHYDKIWAGFQKRYLNLETIAHIANSFHKEKVPIQSVKEMMSLVKSGIFNARVIGRDAAQAQGENEKIIIQMSDGKKLEYDAMISARGFNFDLRKSEDPLCRSMLGDGMISSKIYGGEVDIKSSNISWAINNDEVNQAFKVGREAALVFFKPGARVENFSTSAVVNLQDAKAQYSHQ